MVGGSHIAMLKHQFLSGSSTHLLQNPNSLSGRTARQHGSNNLVRMATPAASSHTREGSSSAAHNSQFPLFGDRAATFTRSDVKARSSSKGRDQQVSATRVGLGETSDKVADSINHQPAKRTSESVKYKGTITVQKGILKLDLVKPLSGAFDDGGNVFHFSVQLVSNDINPTTGKADFRSAEVPFKHTISPTDFLIIPYDFKFELDFHVPNNFGIPGAIIVQNKHPNEFLLASFSLDMPDFPEAQFCTNSWVYNTNNVGRIFFRNQAYLPSETPAGLKVLREQEMRNLRGDDEKPAERQVKDRIYDYDVYNDLGDPDKDLELKRPILGGNPDTPYPRRCRTGRPKTQYDSSLESPSAADANIYIPRDERFDRIKNSDFKADTLRSKLAAALTTFREVFLKKTEFNNMASIMELFVPKGVELNMHRHVPHMQDKPKKEQYPLAYFNELFRPGVTPNSFIRYPLPKYLHADPGAWQLDEEFAREFLAGLNPVMIKLVTEFPIKSKLPPHVCEDPVSAIKAEHIEHKSLNGLEVEQAIAEKRLFVADYHDTFYPYVTRVNALKDTAMYATRALFFKRPNGMLRVIALELVLPPKAKGDKKISRVFTPSGNMEWTLAKAHVSANDIFVHQVISHFTRCHAVTEPVILATNRQLSAMHPIHQLLAPHYKSTMETNIAARKALINAKGIIETVFTPHRYSMEIAAVDYKNHWQFDLQALPNELLSRGMAVEDKTTKHGLKLVIEDYPYAADGLELWSAIEAWIKDYVDIYYEDDATVREDVELNNWWDELRNKGHEDKKDAAGWPKLESRQSLVHIVTTIVWVVSCQHSAVNFGQYHVGAFMPHHPTTTRRLIPEKEGKDWAEFVADRERFRLSMLSDTKVTTTVMSVYEVLSTHSAEEEYLGQPLKNPNWTNNQDVKDKFDEFSKRIGEIERLIAERNEDKSLHNRYGNVEVAYELLSPFSDQGMTAKGVPTGITI